MISDSAGSPLVSFIVTCYNHEAYLADLFDSLLEQKYDNIEILISDDASTDKSWEIIQRYKPILENKFVRVLPIRSAKNRGLTKCLNALLGLCQGDFIKFLSGDDFLTPDYFLIAISSFLENQDVDIFVSNGYVVSNESVYREPKIVRKTYEQAPDLSMNNLFERLYRGSFISPQGAMYSKAVIDRVGFYDENLMFEDWDFWLRVAKANCNFVYSSEKLFYYRLSLNSMSRIDGTHADERMLKMYQGDKQILEKYAGDVTGREAALQMALKIVRHLKFSYINNLHENIRVGEEDYRNFDRWNQISLKDRAELRLRYATRKLGCH